MYVCIDIHTYIVGTPTPCPFQKLSNLGGGGVQNFLLERRDKPGKEQEIDVEMGGGGARCHFFITVQFNHIYYVGGVRFPLVLFGFSVFSVS